MQTGQIVGLAMICLGALLLLENLGVEISDYFWSGLIVAAGIYLIYRNSRK